MLLRQTVLDEEGDIAPTDEIHPRHVDYRDAVEVNGISLPL